MSSTTRAQNWSRKLSRICESLVDPETIDELYYQFRQKLDDKGLRKEVRVKDVEIQIAVEELDDTEPYAPKPYVHKIKTWWNKEMDQMVEFEERTFSWRNNTKFQANPFMVPI